MALGQVVTQIVGRVDTVCDMKQVYTRTTLKSKDVTIHVLTKCLELINIESKKFSNADVRYSTRKASKELQFNI